MKEARDDQVAFQAWEAQRKKHLVPKLRDMFTEMDKDCSGELDLWELLDAPEEIKRQLKGITGLDQAEEIFNLIDYDGSGSVDIEEFCDSLLKAGSDKPAELIRIMKQCTDLLKQSNKMLDMLKACPLFESTADDLGD